MVLKKLNLGCGNDIKDGYVNSDIRNFDGVDVVCDLEKFPYPFKTDEFDEVYLHHVLEHLDDPLKVLEECYRICKSKIVIHVPHFSCNNAYSHFFHKNFYGCRSMCVLCDNNENYVGNKFVLESVKLEWTDSNNVLLKVVGGVIDFLSNGNQIFFERVWCYYVGGSQEVQFILRVNKNVGSKNNEL